MSKVVILDSVLQLKSEMTMCELKRAERFKPEALKLKNEKGEVFFEVAASEETSISKYGICFAGGDASGKLYLIDGNPTCPLEGASKEEIKANVTAKYAEIINNLNQVEKQVKEAAKELDKLEADMEKNIEICE